MGGEVSLVRATDGRVPGRRGIATRARLLACAAELLSTTSYRDIKVIDIAREAGTSPATFYQYFADVEQAVLALAEELAADGAALAELVHRDWRGERAMETSRAIVKGFMDFYEDHRAVFRVVDLATEEGDLRFQRLRTRALSGITEAFTQVVGDLRHEGRLGPEVDPTATSYVLVSMLAHTAAHRYGFEFWGVRTATLSEHVARFIHWGVTGRKPADQKRAGVRRRSG
ncbi:MAG TPA: TetR family transcriptional regulator [Acidimicrobiales bacterium]|nr:TetR family transcriptional regulator [Acidimicrobiales bacterium]